jgi:hypothetical protein
MSAAAVTERVQLLKTHVRRSANSKSLDRFLLFGQTTTSIMVSIPYRLDHPTANAAWITHAELPIPLDQRRSALPARSAADRHGRARHT